MTPFLEFVVGAQTGCWILIETCRCNPGGQISLPSPQLTPNSNQQDQNQKINQVALPDADQPVFGHTEHSHDGLGRQTHSRSNPEAAEYGDTPASMTHFQ